MYNFVTGIDISITFKQSTLFKTNLGRSITTRQKESDRSGERHVTKFSINDSDVFVKFYYEKFKTIIQSVGNIGSINFFTDHYLKNDQIVVYYKEKEFVFTHDLVILKNKGVDNYLGYIIKEIETKYIDQVKDAKDIVLEEDLDANGNPDKLFTNPGAVSYEDLKKYIKQKKNL
jgi:hypothetical protein